MANAGRWLANAGQWLGSGLAAEVPGAHPPLSGTLGTWAGVFLAEKGYQPRCLAGSTDYDDTEFGVLPLVQKKRHQLRCLARPADYDDTEFGVTIPHIKNKTPVKTAFSGVSSCSLIRLHSGKQGIWAQSRIYLPF